MASSVSFHSPIALRINAVISPPRASGSMIDQNVRVGDAPSIADASSSSSGSDRKNPVSRNTVNGSDSATYSTPRPNRLLVRLIFANAMNSGMITVWNGMPMPIAMNPVNGPDPRTPSRDSAYAAGADTTTITTEHTATSSTVLKNAVP